jgi:TetR/AcrR family transcriptional repressor of mexJK operon
LAVASELFLAKGYDGVSLDEIIAAVGGSKTTIYSYFEGKEGVFVAAVSALCDEILAKLLRTKAFSMPLREALQAIGHAYLDAVLSPRAVALQRLVIGEAHRFPEVGRIWFESGPAQTYRLLTDFFEERRRTGEIASVDPHKTAVLFHDMLTYEIHQQVLLGIMAKPKRAVLSDKVRSAIDVLLNGCKGI